MNNFNKISILLFLVLFNSLSALAVKYYVYSSSTAATPNTQYVSASDANKEILKVSLVIGTEGNGGQDATAVTIDQMRFTLSNTSNADLSDAKLFYTGTTATFNTNTQVGSTVTSPTGQITFTFTTSIAAISTHYFWLTYSVVASPTGCNTLDATYDDVSVTNPGTSPDGLQTPTTTNPTGSIPIKGTPCFFIGNGTSLNTLTGGNTPFGNYYEGRKNQFLITATNLTDAGVGSERSISRLAFNVNDVGTCNGLNNFVIYMKNTATTALTTTWETGLTLVYSNSSYQPVVGWTEITFNNSFLWDGTSNVLIEICFNDEGIEGFTQNPKTYYNASGATTTHYVAADNDADLCTNPGAGSTSTDRPNIKLRIAVTSGNMEYVSCTAAQGLTTNVTKTSTNNRILDLNIVTTKPDNALSATSFSFNTTGCTDASTDITNAKLFYTETTNTFATTTQIGSTVTAPDGVFTITPTQALLEGTNYFWLTYDIPSGATTANLVDAECTSITVTSARTPITTAPSGTRTIEGAMVYSSCTVGQVDDFAGVDILNQEVIRMEIVTTGTTSAIDATSFTLFTGGTPGTSDIADITDISIDLYYTGTTNSFNTNTLFGSATDPNDIAVSFVITGTQTLSEGTNYFWMAYDVPSGATIDNVIDGKCTSITVDGTARTPTTQDPAGSRTIVQTWGGATASWGTSSNWAPAVIPTSTTNVYIASGRVADPTISSTSYCNNLTIQSGATLTCDVGGPSTVALLVYGNITNNGTLSRLDKPIRFYGNNMIHTLEGTGTFTNDGDGTSDLDVYEGTTSLASDISWGYIAIYDTLMFNSYTLTLNKNLGFAVNGDIEPGTGKLKIEFASGSAFLQDEDFYDLELAGGATYTLPTSAKTINTLVTSGTAIVNAGANLIVNSTTTIGSGTSLDGKTFTMTFKGNFTNNGTFTPSTGTVTFNSSAAQTLGGTTAPTFYNLTINNTSSTGVTLSTPVTVNNTLTLTDGLLYTDGTNLLTLGVDAAAISGASSASFISGPVAKVKNTTPEYIFQTGKGTRYVRIGITPVSTALTTYQAEHFNAAYSNTTTMGAGMNHVGTLQYWQMDRTAGSANAKVRLYWDASSNSGGVDLLADLRVSRWDGTQWTDAGQASTTGTTADGTILSNEVANFSPFNLGSSSANNPLPVKLLYFTATPVANYVDIKWATGTEENNDFFTIEKSADGLNYENVATIDGQGTTFNTSYYNIKDENPMPGTSYYRLSQTDFDGTTEQFHPVPVTFASKKFELVGIHPNPTDNTTVILFNANENDIATLKLYNSLGQQLKVEQSRTTSGLNSIALDVSEYKKGLYFIHLENANQEVVQSKLIKTDKY